MKTKIIRGAAAIIAALLLITAGAYASAGVIAAKKSNSGGKDTIELITGLPGMRDTAVATLGALRDHFPAGSHSTATLRVQYREGDTYFWADEAAGELDADSGETLVLSLRQHNIIYAEVEICVTDANGAARTYTVEKTR